MLTDVCLLCGQVDKMEKQKVLQTAIRNNIAKEHQREILNQVDEARNRMRCVPNQPVKRARGIVTEHEA